LASLWWAARHSKRHLRVASFIKAFALRAAILIVLLHSRITPIFHQPSSTSHTTPTWQRPRLGRVCAPAHQPRNPLLLQPRAPHCSRQRVAESIKHTYSTKGRLATAHAVSPSRAPARFAALILHRCIADAATRRISGTPQQRQKPTAAAPRNGRPRRTRRRRRQPDRCSAVAGVL